MHAREKTGNVTRVRILRVRQRWHTFLDKQLNPALAHFKGLVRIILYIEVLFIANLQITMKTLLGTKNCMRYWQNYV